MEFSGLRGGICEWASLGAICGVGVGVIKRVIDGGCICSGGRAGGGKWGLYIVYERGGVCGGVSECGCGVAVCCDLVGVVECVGGVVG